MTRDETKKILERVCRLYISQARRLTAEQRSAMVDTWANEFKDTNYADIDEAVSTYMKRGKPFMPEVADIINALNAETKAIKEKPAEGERLFQQMVDIADTIVNGKARTSITDPGGIRWDADLQTDVYKHPELVVDSKSYTQYDFAQLPEEIQEYVEDIQGLRLFWKELQSNSGMAKKRFLLQLPDIKAEIAAQKAKNKAENQKRIEELKRRMLDSNRRRADI